MTDRDNVPLGSVEPHRLLLDQPPIGQLVYKVMSTENFARCVEGKYLYFNRVDSYKDFPNADAHDGEEFPADRERSQLVGFQKAPEFTISHYYRQSRERTYACCLSMENSAFIWSEYGTGGARGKIGLTFDFDKLRAMLNRNIQQAIDHDLLMCGDIKCHQIFSINYGLVRYVDRENHTAIDTHLVNPMTYIFLKDQRFKEEIELRISMSALGIGHFAIHGGQRLQFSAGLPVHFDFREAFETGVIKRLDASSPDDRDWLNSQAGQSGLQFAA